MSKQKNLFSLFTPKSDFDRLLENDPKLFELFLKTPNDYDMGRVVGALQNNTSLSSLILEFDEGIHEFNFEILVNAFKRSAMLTSLTIKGISNEAIISFSSTLKDITSIKSLKLISNQMNDEAIFILLEGLKVKKTLNSLVLQGNQLSDQSVPILNELLNDNFSIIKLEVPKCINYDKVLLLQNQKYCALVKKISDFLEIQHFARTTQQYNALIKEIKSLCKSRKVLIPECGEFIYRLLNGKYQDLLENKDNKSLLWIQNYNQLCEEVHDFCNKYPLMPQFGWLIFNLLSFRCEHFIESSEKKSSVYDKLCKKIHTLSKKNPNLKPQYEELLQKLEEVLPDVNNFMETEHMKQIKEDFARDLDLLKKELLLTQQENLQQMEGRYSEILKNNGRVIEQLQKELNDQKVMLDNQNNLIKTKDSEIDQLRNDIVKQQLNANEKTREIEALRNDLRTQQEQHSEQVYKIEKLEFNVRNLQQRNQNNLEETVKVKIEEKDREIQGLQYVVKDLKDYLGVQVILPKYFDGLLELANTEIGKQTLIASLAHPKAKNLENLCLIPFTHELKNVEELKEKGAIVSWEQLEDALADINNLTQTSRKRLKVGLEQLLNTWPTGQLQNHEAQVALDEKLLEILRDEFESLQEYPEIANKLKKLNTLEIEQWFENREGLTPERREELQALIFRKVYEWCLISLEEAASTYASLQVNMRELLVEQYRSSQVLKDNSFPDSSEVLNQESLGELIRTEKLIRTKALDSLIVSEINLIKQNDQTAYDRPTLSQKAAEQIALKWLNGEIQDPKVLKPIIQMAGQLLTKKEFLEKHGDLHSTIKKKAVELMLIQFDDPQSKLLYETRNELAEKITDILKDPKKYSHEQIEIVQQEILQEFKAGSLSNELKLRCVNFLEKPLKELKELLNLNDEKTEELKNPTPTIEEIHGIETKDIFKKPVGDFLRMFPSNNNKETSETSTFEVNNTI